VDAVLPFSAVERPAATAGFGALYDETVDVAWRMLARLGVGREELEDAVQDVYVVAHRRLHTLKPDARLSTWVAGIAVRVAHDYRRRASRKPAVPLDEHASTLEDLRARPDDALVRAQAADLLQVLLDRLEPTQREVFVLAELEHVAVTEVAELTGAPLNTVYSRLRLARARMNELAAQLDGGPG
jgi:RNA polymerase sigma-70 factor (ECF subfamily)